METIPIFPIELKRSRGSASVAGNHRAALTALPPLSLYVHVPWCVRKCPYCDFNSHEHPAGAASLPEAEYLAAVRSDLESALPSIWGRRVHTVFLGGGTPSLLSARALDELLCDIRARVLLEADAEITMEANPGTFEAQKFEEFARLGINRLSIGIQSFNDRHLHALGRIHDADQAHRAIEIAQRHFTNFNLDLMYALPEQTFEDAQQDVAQALAAGATHLSMYHLTLEPNTYFASHPPSLPDDGLASDMQDMIDETLRRSGYLNYEVSAFAQKARACQHNLNYWNFGDYLGIGPGAHSKISFPDRIVRQVRFKRPATYLERALTHEFIQDEHEIAGEDLPFEFMLNALRLTEGISLRRFSERTGLGLDALSSGMDEAIGKGLLNSDGLRICATELGRRFLNDLQAIFLPTR